jgi:DNA helicase HerA-like ATPase
VWRYDIAPLSRAESQFFVDCLLTKIFRHAKTRGEADGPDTVIVIDEASIFVDKDDDHIINILIREGRKFGVMIILAAQEVSVFPPAILSSAATKLILGVDDLYHKATEDRLGFERGKLKYLKPKKTAFVQCKRSVEDSLGQGFYEVEIMG